MSSEQKENQSEKVISVLISGAAGQIGYAVIPMFATGLVFGPNQPIELHLLEIEPAMKSLNGVAMEITDGAYPLVRKVVATFKAEEAFKDIDYAVLVGGFPRQAGMERKQLMEKNAPIFKAMGEGLEKYAKKTCKVLVIANPVNTNALVCSHHAPKIPKKNFAALTRLDQNRALAQLAEKLAVPVAHVRNVAIWGNHSTTQVPDVTDAQVLSHGKYEHVKVDSQWVRGDFTKIVQQRGKAIIDARGMSSALSAANAIKDCLRDWVQGTREGEHVAMGVFTDGCYGITDELVFSFPCICKNGDYQIVKGLKLDEDMEKLLKSTQKELLEEKGEAGLK